MARVAAIAVAVGLFGVGVVGIDVKPASAGGSADWKQVSAGFSHTCGVTTGGRLFCWGNDADGRLGDSDGTDSSPTPLEVAGSATDWKQVAAGDTHTCATKTDGRLFCWGSDGTGQVGDGTVGNPASNFTPTEVTGSATDWKRVAAGNAHTCATKTDGRLFCWGNDGLGALGDGTSSMPTTNPSPLQVTGNATNWKRIAVGDGYTCAAKTNGRLFCWGDDTQGQLGDGTFGNPTANASPLQVVGNSKKWKQVAAGNVHTCATKTNGRAFCWGLDESGRLGDGLEGNPFPNPAPVQVTGNATNWKPAAVGNAHTCATKKNHRLFCWGNDSDGVLGDGTPGTPTVNASPLQVTGNATDWQQVTAGEGHTCATKTDGRLFCWGDDTSGQLGDGTFGTPDDNPAPLEVVPHP